jgi:hypothetical protein
MVAVGTCQALIHCRCHDDGHAVAMHFEAMAAGAAVVRRNDEEPCCVSCVVIQQLGELFAGGCCCVPCLVRWHVACKVTDKDLVPHLARLGFESGVHYIATESTVGTYQPLQ